MPLPAQKQRMIFKQPLRVSDDDACMYQVVKTRKPSTFEDSRKIPAKAIQVVAANPSKWNP
jgi:hypothetical protein